MKRDEKLTREQDVALLGKEKLGSLKTLQHTAIVTKKCNTCHKDKPLSEYQKNWQGYFGDCKSCHEGKMKAKKTGIPFEPPIEIASPEETKKNFLSELRPMVQQLKETITKKPYKANRRKRATSLPDMTKEKALKSLKYRVGLIKGLREKLREKEETIENYKKIITTQGPTKDPAVVKETEQFISDMLNNKEHRIVELSNEVNRLNYTIDVLLQRITILMIGNIDKP